MSKRNLYETNFNLLVQLKILSENGVLRSNSRSKMRGYKDLVFEQLPHIDNLSGNLCNGFSIAHYSEQDGLSFQNPEMVLLVYPQNKIVEAFSFHAAMSDICEAVYPEPGKCCQKAKEEQNSYLHTWLVNLTKQGHGVFWQDRQLEMA